MNAPSGETLRTAVEELARPTGAAALRRYRSGLDVETKRDGSPVTVADREEAAELVLACGDEDRARAVDEGADLVYHTLVALRALSVDLDDVRRALDRRAAPRVAEQEGVRADRV